MGDWRELFPFESNYFTTPAPAGRSGSIAPRMHYVDQGAGDQTILCVHGNPTWSFHYRTIVQTFRDRMRVVAVDHVGMGLSDKPPGYPYCLEQHISNLGTLIDALDARRVTLVVHDWGGAIGLGAALRDPTRIERLIVLNTGAFPPPYIPWRIALCRLPIVGNVAMRGLNLFALAALRMTLARLRRLDSTVAAGLIAPYSSWSNRIGIARFVQDIPTRASHATWSVLRSIEERLPELSDRPAPIVWGMRDWCFRPDCLDRMAQLLPNAKIRRLSDVGHYVMEEAAREVLDAVDDCLNER